MLITLSQLPEEPEDYDSTAIFPVHLTALIWDATTPGRAIRRFVLDYYMTTVFVRDIRARIDESHPEFIKDVMLLALEIDQGEQERVNPNDREMVHYHDHDE